MKEKIKKVLNRLLKAFMWAYEIFLYSLALPLVLGITVLFAPLANQLSDFFFKHMFIYILASVIVGLLIRKWRRTKRKP